MAVRDSKKPLSLTSFLFLSLLSIASLFFAFSLFKATSSSSTASLSPHHHKNFEYFNPAAENSQPKQEKKEEVSSIRGCDYSDGEWIYDPTTVRSTARYDHTCKEIYKGWNCIGSHKSNALEIVKWRWKPRQCDLPQFDPLRFLKSFRDTNIGCS